MPQSIISSSQEHLLLTQFTQQVDTYLSIITSSVQYLESAHEELPGYQYWKELQRSCCCLNAILRNMKEYEQPSAPSQTRVDLQKLLREVYLSCLPLTEGTSHSLLFSSRTNGPFLTADAQKLFCAFVNLVQNGLEALPAKGSVHILLSRTRTNAVVQFRDTGCGIPPEQLLTIFTPFVAYRHGGNGLGLAVVKKIIEEHGGHISVSSCPGKGSTFSVTLPCGSSLL